MSTQASTTPAENNPAPTSTAGIINVGTRKSALAVKQTELVIEELRALHPDFNAKIHAMATAGDKDQISKLYTMGKGLWTSELEAKLMAGELDMVVHCLKDMPTNMPEGCVLGCIIAREDPRDVLVVKESLRGQPGYSSLRELPAGSVIGTSSVRRVAQLRRRYPALRFKDVRGNIQTRLSKLDDEEEGYTALVLAAAGLLRMDYNDRITEYLDLDSEGTLYAVGQGALCIEVREGNERIMSILRGLEDRDTMLACTAERTVMRTLEGGCSVPIGVETKWLDASGSAGEPKQLRLRATVVALDGKQAVDAEMVERISNAEEAEVFGKRVAQDLVDRGAGKILEEINNRKASMGAEVLLKTD